MEGIPMEVKSKFEDLIEMTRINDILDANEVSFTALMKLVFGIWGPRQRSVKAPFL